MITTALIWGAAGPVIKFTLGEIDPLPFLSYRFLLAGILAAFIIITKRLSLPKSLKLKFLLITYGLVATTFALGLLFIGLDNATVLELELITVVGPLLIALGGVVFLREKISKQEVLGIAIALLGVFIVTIYPILTQTDGHTFSGNILIILYLLFDTSSVLIARELVLKKVQPSVITSWAFVVAALTMLPLTLLYYPPSALLESLVTLPFPHHLGVWYMAFISGTIAYWLLAKAEKYIEAGEAGLFFYLIPIFAAPLAVLWLHEKISIRFVIGGTIIGMGVAIAEYRRAKKRRGTKRRK